MSNEMELFSFVLDESSYMDEDVYFMKLPKSWDEYLASKRNARNFYQLNIIPSSLGKKLQSIFPAIFRVSWTADRYWLISDQKIDCDLLKLICLDWFRKEEKSDLPERMSKETLNWKKVKLGRLIEDKEYDNFRFNSMVAFVARRFARTKRTLQVQSSLKGNPSLSFEMEFKHIYYNGYHECMSQLIYNETKDFYFAYVIRFKYETRGFMPEKGILNVKIGTRRFLERGIDVKKGIRWGRDGTIFLGIKNPFYEYSPIQSMAPFTFEIYKQKVRWKRGADELFADVLLGQNQLNPENILEDPLSYYNQDGVIALPVFSDLVYRFYNPTRAGIGLPEKSALFDLVKKSLPELKPLQTLKQLRGWRYGHRKFPLLNSFIEGKKIIFEIWGDERLEKQLIHSLLSEKVIEKKLGELYALNSSPEVYIEFLRRDPNHVIHALDSEAYGENAENRYMRKLNQHLLKIDGRKSYDFILSLIEILKPAEYGADDPKESIRKSFIKRKRITQFIHPDDSKSDNYKNRLLNSFYDLLTDIGFLPNHYENLGYKGVTLSLGSVSGPGNLEFPVISKLVKNELKVKLFGDDVWHSFPETLLKISSLKEKDFLFRKKWHDKEKSKSFFKRNLLDVVEDKNEEIIILVDNRIKYLYNLFTNGNLNVEKVFEDMELLKYKDRVHFIRVNPSNEIPQYRINKEGEVVANRGAGVFKDPMNIYYTVSVRPDTMQETNDDHLKYDYPKKHFMQQRITEFIPLSFMENKLDELGLIAFKMRRLSIPYKFHLSVPYNLHLNNKLRKYVSFLSDSPYIDDFNEEVEVYEQMTFDFSHT